MASIPDQVRDLIADHLALGNPPRDESTFEALGADSLDALELAMALEDEFRITVADDELAGATTVADCIALIERKLAERTEQVPL